MKSTFSLLAAAASILPAAAQLSGTVGPLTSRSDKATVKTCNIMDYGGVADASTDNSAAISSAWDDCKTGGEVYIPEGDYGLSSWLTLTGGSAVSFCLDGILYRTGTDGGNMIMIEHTTDFEFYSSTSAGAIQGYGYEFHQDDEYGPRILRFYEVESFSIHDIILVDSPAFHFTMDTCTDGEVYNIIIRGANEGGLDGIDVWGTNIWIHDVEVTNKDECVTVKSPADHILVESVFCNWSGGCAMGSLGADTDIHDIEYNHVFTQAANQMYMIKSNGGSGSVYNVLLDTFTGHGNAYTLDFDSYWSSMSEADGDGVQYSNVSFSNWSGTCSSGTTRGPIKVFCPTDVPCYDISITDFNVGSEDGDEILYTCENAYGSGGCLASGDDYAAYTTTITTSAPSATATSMDGELSAGLGLTVSIDIPTMPASFYPGVAPSSAFMSDSAAAGAATSTAAVSSVAASSIISSSVAIATSESVGPISSSVAAVSSIASSSSVIPTTESVGPISSSVAAVSSIVSSSAVIATSTIISSEVVTSSTIVASSTTVASSGFVTSVASVTSPTFSQLAPWQGGPGGHRGQGFGRHQGPR